MGAEEKMVVEEEEAKVTTPTPETTGAPAHNANRGGSGNDKGDADDDDDDVAIVARAAREVAKHLPYFPFKGIDKFYDIGGFLYRPDVFQMVVDAFARRYHRAGVDVVAG